MTSNNYKEITKNNSEKRAAASFLHHHLKVNICEGIVLDFVVLSSKNDICYDSKRINSQVTLHYNNDY